MTDTQNVKWKNLKSGDVIVCPVSGLEEKVTSAHKYVRGEWFVRTSRHDHYRPANETVPTKVRMA